MKKLHFCDPEAPPAVSQARTNPSTGFPQTTLFIACIVDLADLLWFLFYMINSSALVETIVLLFC